jgi:hypothetical protein
VPVKILTREELNKKKRRSRKSRALEKQAEKLLENGDLVQYIPHRSAAHTALDEGDVGMIVAVEESRWRTMHYVLCKHGILLVDPRNLIRIQEYMTPTRRDRVGPEQKIIV